MGTPGSVARRCSQSSATVATPPRRSSEVRASFVHRLAVSLPGILIMVRSFRLSSLAARAPRRQAFAEDANEELHLVQSFRWFEFSRPVLAIAGLLRHGCDNFH